MYWTPKSNAANGLAGAITPTTGIAQVPKVEKPEIGAQILLELMPWGMTRLFNVETDQPNQQATYLELEVKALKKPIISFE